MTLNLLIMALMLRPRKPAILANKLMLLFEDLYCCSRYIVETCWKKQRRTSPAESDHVCVGCSVKGRAAPVRDWHCTSHM